MRTCCNISQPEALDMFNIRLPDSIVPEALYEIRGIAPRSEQYLRPASPIHTDAL